MEKNLQKIKEHAIDQIETTNRAIELMQILGAKAPQVMIDANEDHQLILDELENDSPSLDKIGDIINRINKRL